MESEENIRDSLQLIVGPGSNRKVPSWLRAMGTRNGVSISTVRGSDTWGQKPADDGRVDAGRDSGLDFEEASLFSERLWNCDATYVAIGT